MDKEEPPSGGGPAYADQFQSAAATHMVRSNQPQLSTTSQLPIADARFPSTTSLPSCLRSNQQPQSSTGTSKMPIADARIDNNVEPFVINIDSGNVLAATPPDTHQSNRNAAGRCMAFARRHCLLLGVCLFILLGSIVGGAVAAGILLLRDTNNNPPQITSPTPAPTPTPTPAPTPAPPVRNWTLHSKLPVSDLSNLSDGDQFGFSIAFHSDYCMVGAPFDDLNPTDSINNNGKVHVFIRYEDRSWDTRGSLFLFDSDVSVSKFGYSVALFKDTAMVGTGIGASLGPKRLRPVYVFEKEDFPPIWWQVGTLLPSNITEDVHNFGRSIALQENTCVIGSERTQSGVPSSAYVFSRNNNKTSEDDGMTMWKEVAMLLSRNGIPENNFGCAVALDGDTIVVGSSLEQNDKDQRTGAVYIFVVNNSEDNGVVWTEQARLFASDGVAWDYFGESVAIDGDTVLVGAWGEDAKGQFAGAAYVFVRNPINGTWTEQAKLLANDGRTSEHLGEAVALSGDTAVVGASGGVGIKGSVVIFERDAITNNWMQKTRLRSPDVGAYSEENDEFGSAVAIDGKTIVVGAKREKNQTGAVYVYDLE